MARISAMRILLRPNVMLAIVGVVAGVIGAIAAGHLVQARTHAAEGALNARYLPREVIVAARDLSAGQRIEAQMLATRRMPRDFLPSGALAATDAGSLIGRHMSVDLQRGDPVQLSNINRREGLALSSLVHGGGRAMTISVDDTNSMAGMVRPGDIVDLYYSRSQGDGSVLVPLLERIEVLAAGESLKGAWTNPGGPGDSGNGFATLTILVTSEDAARVVLAQSTGTLTVLLRSNTDLEPATVETRNSRYLLTRLAPGRLSDRIPSEGVELIVGGSGTVTPEVSQLNVGAARVLRNGGRT